MLLLTGSIDAANNSDTVQVDKGTYVENLAVIEKHIALSGNALGDVTVQGTSSSTLWVESMRGSHVRDH
jgi:hypothetical protein